MVVKNFWNNSISQYLLLKQRLCHIYSVLVNTVRSIKTLAGYLLILFMCFYFILFFFSWAYTLGPIFIFTYAVIHNPGYTSINFVLSGLRWCLGISIFLMDFNIHSMLRNIVLTLFPWVVYSHNLNYCADYFYSALI